MSCRASAVTRKRSRSPLPYPPLISAGSWSVLKRAGALRGLFRDSIAGQGRGAGDIWTGGNVLGGLPFPPPVRAGLVPATHTHNCATERMGRRDKPGDDEHFGVSGSA